jgi:hypothetical protein
MRSAVLTAGDKDRINHGFSVFDHDWKSYSQLFGEPFLVNGDTLMYWDGRAAHVAAFRIGDVERPYSSQEIHRLLSSLPGEAELITVSGNLSPETTALRRMLGQPLRTKFESREYAAASGLTSFVNHTIDTESFDYARQRDARLRRNKVRNSAISTVASQPRGLSASQQSLIEGWAANHPTVTSENLALAAAMRSVVLHDDVWVVSATKEDTEVGFGVLAKYGNVLQFIQMYPNRTVPHVGDAIMDASIRLAQQLECHTLNMGHSATPSLLRYKQSWGAQPSGPQFSALGFGKEEAVQAASQGRFLWHQRVGLGTPPPPPLDPAGSSTAPPVIRSAAANPAGSTALGNRPQGMGPK